MYKEQAMTTVKLLRIPILYLMGITAILSACSNSLDLVAPDDPIPVVCCRMDPADQIFYLTLTKSFSGNGSGFDLARDPGNVYYENADIRLEAWEFDYKVWETPFIPADRSKDPGIFPEMPGFCYITRDALPFVQMINGQIDFWSDITSFRLVINHPGELGQAISRIPILELPVKLHPSNWEKSLDLYPSTGNFDLDFLLNDDRIKYCELICLFRYREFREAWEDRSVTFSLRKNIQINDHHAGTYIDPDLFFNKLLVNVKPIDSTLVRKFISLDLVFLAGDQYYKDYSETYVNAGNMDSPPLGNISNGYGLFTMVRSVRLNNMSLTPRTLDSLARGFIARPLGFSKW
jgi:hypothetical protein